MTMIRRIEKKIRCGFSLNVLNSYIFSSFSASHLFRYFFVNNEHRYICMSVCIKLCLTISSSLQKEMQLEYGHLFRLRFGSG